MTDIRINATKRKIAQPTIGHVLKAWLHEYGPQMKKASRDRARCYIKNELDWFGEHFASELTHEIVWEYVLTQIQAGKMPGTVVGGLTYLRRALSLFWDGYISVLTWEPTNDRRGRNPSKMIAAMMQKTRDRFAHLEAKPKAFTVEEQKTVLAVTEEIAPDWLEFVRLAMRTGMRRSELRALKWDCVDLTAGTIELRRNFSVDEEGSPKTGKKGCRTVHLSPGAIVRLRALREVAGDVEWVFHRAGSFLSSGVTGHALAAILAEAQARGVRKGCTLHSARRAYVSQGREKMSDAWMQKQVGHSAATQRDYTRPEVTLPPDLSWADV